MEFYFVETATDNNTRTVANIKMYFNKNGGLGSNRFFRVFSLIEKLFLNLIKPENMELEELELEVN